MTELLAIYDQIPLFILTFVRLGGLFLFGPMLASSVIPIRVRIGLAFVLSFAIHPVLVAQGIVVSPELLKLHRLAPLIIFNATIGVAIGFLANLPMIAVQTGGLMMGQQ
ncbi:MAG: flagellar biosynthetic protein FliR, partial [Phycisphaerales bacterium]|nr:flagellar biosynthetic protein FliR [Phycisphaerales bacterium]